MRKSVLAWINIGIFLAMVTVNYLANALPINGLDTGQVSDLYPNMFTPAGITFSIWSVIYILLAGFTIYQWRVFVKSETYTPRYFAEFSLWFIASSILNLSWIIAWHHLFTGLSLTIMFVLLFTIARLFLLSRRYTAHTVSDKLFIRIPFTIYLAWISVATIANTTTFLVSLGWNGSILSEVTWAIIMMIVAASLAVYITNRFLTPGYTGVVLWAILGIFIRWYDQDQPHITYAAASLLIILSAYLVYVLGRKTSQTQPSG